MALEKYCDRSVDFALQEHSLLRNEIISLIADTRSLERNAVVAVGIVWGFLALHPPLPKDRWAWWVPTLFAILGALRTWAINTAFCQISTYLMCTEKLFAEDGGAQGWETFLNSARRSIFLTAKVFWMLLLLATSAVALYESVGRPF